MTQEIIPPIEISWEQKLKQEFNAPYFKQLKEFLLEERKNGSTIYPSVDNIFAAFHHTPFNTVKVVLIGQDPYHGEGQAHGLSFSVPEGFPLPPSLLNIFKELNNEYGWPIVRKGTLTKWAKQGVLLLNATLTVKAGSPGTHQNKGWENFTDAVISKISAEKNGVVFLLWGNFAHAKEKLIDTSKHYILKAAHPSPLSAYKGFFNCGHFKQTNDLLIKAGVSPIDWKIE